jgi:hypothetical protein
MTEPILLIAMAEPVIEARVWIGVAGVTPRDGCDLLSAQEGAFVNFLTLASSESEYRAKVSGALSHYHLELLQFQDVRPLSESTTHLKTFWRSRLSWRKAGIRNMYVTRHSTFFPE